MVDTITLRITKATSYGLIEYFNSIDSGTTIVETTQAALKAAANKSIKMAVYSDRDRYLVFTKRDKLYNPSSNYEIAVKPNVQRDFIELEFSMPKEKWGHNIAQLIDFSDQSSGACYDVFIRSVWDFVDRSLPVRIADEDIQVRRIDMCYNQFFEHKQDALNYKDEAGKNFSRLSRANGRQPVPFGEGFQFVTRRFSFKMYHKGTEFRKNDYYKLLEKPVGNISIPVLAGIADRILRYEVTFRHSYLDYLFNRMYEKTVLPGRTVKGTLYRRLFFMMNVLGSKSLSRDFCLSSEYDCSYVENHELVKFYRHLVCPGSVTFDRLLFSRLWAFTWSCIRKVQVTSTAGDYRLIIDRVRLYNRKLKDQYRKPVLVSEKRILLWFRLSQKSGGLRQAVKKGFMSERNYYYVLKVFRAIGLSDYNPVLKLVTPGLDYRDYKSCFSSLH